MINLLETDVCFSQPVSTYYHAFYWSTPPYRLIWFGTGLISSFLAVTDDSLSGTRSLWITCLVLNVFFIGPSNLAIPSSTIIFHGTRLRSFNKVVCNYEYVLVNSFCLEKFIQYDDSDYFHLDTLIVISTGLCWFLNNNTIWACLTSSDVRFYTVCSHGQ